MTVAQALPVRLSPAPAAFTNSELQKIAQDALQGLQYAFLTVAARPDKPFAAGSVEEAFRRALLSRKPERRSAYQAKAAEVAGRTLAERQALFGRHGALAFGDYTALGFAGALAKLPTLKLDAARLKPGLLQLVTPLPPQPGHNLPLAGPGPQALTAPTRVPTLAPAHAPSHAPSHAFGGAPGGTPAPAVTALGFYLTEVRCIDETDPEIGTDEISVGGLAIDEGGNTRKFGPFAVSQNFVENAGTVVYPNVGQQLSAVRFPLPGQAMVSFDPGPVGHWPQNYAVILTLAEVDDGGFADFLNDAWQQVAPTIKQLIENAVAAAGAAFGAIGAFVGKVLGKILAWLADVFVGWIIDWFKDDLSAPGTALVALNSADGASYFNSNGWSAFGTPEGQFDFKWAGGEYTVRCRWQVEVPGYLQDKQAFQGHYVGVFRAGDDGHALWVSDWSGFVAKWQAFSNANLRLVDLNTFVDGSTRLFAGVFRAATDAHALWVGAEWADFQAKWTALSQQGLRLVGLRTYFDGGKRLYAGVFRAGTDPHALWAGLDWAAFTAKWDAASQQGLRLVDISSYSEGGKRLFNGVFRAGSGGHALWLSDWAAFTAKWTELSNAGLRLVDVETFVDNGKPMFAGVYRAGTGGYLLWDGNWASFQAKWQDASQQGLRLVDLASY